MEHCIQVNKKSKSFHFKQQNRWAFFLFLVMCLGGCGDDGPSQAANPDEDQSDASASGPDANQSGQPVIAADFWPQAVRAACHAVFQCDAGAGNGSALILARGGLFYGGYPSRDRCLEAVEDGTHPSLEGGRSFQARLAAGLVQYDADKAGECLQEFEDFFCDIEATKRVAIDDSAGGAPGLQACEEVFRGVQPMGASCSDTLECQPGNQCTANDTGDACGTCIDASLSSPCGDDDGPRCQAGEFCDFNDDTCKPRAEAGATCDQDDACASGLVCNNPDGDDAGPKTCITALSLQQDQGCLDTAACAADLVCVQNTCQTLQVFGPDEVCRNDEGTLGACAGGLFCDRQLDPPVCKPLRGVGQTCAQFNSCATGSYCTSGPFSTEEGVCEAAKPLGAECSGSSECASNVCSEPTSDTDDTPRTCVEDATFTACGA